MPSNLFAAPRAKLHASKAAATLFGVLIFLAVPAAAQWRVAPSISVGLNYDDNFFLVDDTVSTESVNGWALQGDAKFSYESQLTKFSMTPKIRTEQYDSDLDLDTNSAFFDFDYLYTGQLSRFQFRGSYSDETVRSGERSDIDFEVEDPDDIPADDSGRVFGIEDRQRIRLTPSWSYRTGSKSSIGLSASYLDVAYDDSQINTLRDYTESSFQTFYEYDWSETSTVGLSGYYRISDFVQFADDITGYGLKLNFRRSLTETTVLRMAVGADSTEDDAGDDQTNPIGEISLIRNFETYRLLASYQRSVQGSGASTLSVRDRFSLNLTRDLSEKLKIGAGVRAYQTSALDDNAANFDERDYVQIGGLLSWRLSQALSMRFDYRYTYIDREVTNSDASSNQLNLWFTYSPIL